jgi:translocation and assembly module TamA
LGLRDLSWVAFLAFVASFGAIETVHAVAGIAYETQFTGIDDDQLTGELRQSSQLVALQNSPPDSEAALRRRTVADLERLRAVTSAAGYYDAVLGYEIDQSQQPWLVTVKIALGTAYRLSEVRLVAPEGMKLPADEPFDPAEFGLMLGERALSASIVNAEARIVRRSTEHGYPLARMIGREAVIDRADHTMQVTYTLDAGPPAAFGATTIDGLKSVDRRFVERKLEWREGDLYDSSKVEAAQKSLIDSNLFATVKIEPADAVEADGRIAIHIVIAERRQRSIGGGLYYDSSLGPGARAFWENRNLLGEGERLQLEGRFGLNEYGGLAEFTRPDFLMRSLDLRSELSLTQENFDAYDSRRASAFAGVIRRFEPSLTGGAGLEFRQAHVNDDTGVQDYVVVDLPLYLQRDDTDDLLNPTRGTRLGLTVTPFRSIDGADLTFVSLKATGSGYRQLGSSDRFVLAGFANVGSLDGVSLGDLPRDLRLYAGGGSSVRGYGYQQAGPLDSSGNPTGGLSSLEFGLELRTKITESIGIATFFESGSVYDRSYPDFGERLFWGTGLGLRYYSPIGPLRFDVAFPLNRRNSDAPFQFYVSLGQAF